MAEIKKEGILIEKTALSFENEGVLNPAAISTGDYTHLFYRAVSKGNHSSIGYCKLKGPLTVEERFDSPVLFPQYTYESQGIEDPRIVKIDDLYYLTYTAFDGKTALGALATSKDLRHFEKQGLIVPQIKYEEFKQLTGRKGKLNSKYARYNKEHLMMWDKNVIFFPRRINGKLYFLHRIRPDIQIVSVDSLKELTKEFWQNYFLHFHESIVLSSKYRSESVV